MLSLTSCALSHVTNVYNETELYEDTESGHCTSILLVAVWPSPHFIRSLHYCHTLIYSNLY